MFRRTNHGWIGLDLGASSIKLAQVARRGGRLQLIEAAVVPRREAWRTAELVESAAVSSLDELQAALATAPHCSGRTAAAVLPTSACEFNTAGEVESGQVAAIADELAALGVNLRNRVFDYWPGIPPGRKSNSKFGHVNVLSTSRAWADTLTGDLVGAGLDCQTIDGLPTALTRAVAEIDSSPAGTVLGALDWGYASATFVVIDQSGPVYVRALKNTALADALDEVARQLDLEAEEVVDLVTTVNIAASATTDEVSAAIAEMLEPALAALCGEVERTLDFLQSPGRNLNPKKIYLFGGGATIGGIDACLSRRLDAQVVVWRLDADSEQVAAARGLSTCLLGPAIALSALKWGEA